MTSTDIIQVVLPHFYYDIILPMAGSMAPIRLAMYDLYSLIARNILIEYLYFIGYGHSVVKRGLGYGGFYGPYGFPGYGFHAYGGARNGQK